MGRLLQQGEGKSAACQCADGALIIDGFARHGWQGAGACVNWHNDYPAYVTKGQITHSSVALGEGPPP